MSGDVPKLISVRIRETQSLPAHLDDQITFGWLVFPRISGAQESGRASRYHEAPCCFFEQVSDFREHFQFRLVAFRGTLRDRAFRWRPFFEGSKLGGHRRRL